VSDTNRRARFYQLTRRGRKQLATESGRWEMLTQAVARAMRPSRVKG
jgi:PadR family transcriptional regulator, regulatory protein PadR